MKALKLILIFILLAVALVGCLWILGFVGEEAAGDIIQKAVRGIDFPHG